jgi:hypothetical protein
MKNKKLKKYSSVVIAACCVSGALVVAEDTDRLQALEKQMASMTEEMNVLRGEQRDLAVLEQQVEKIHFGSYGEIHANFEESGKDVFDIHRLVLYLGYDFNEWIKLSSETEIEHAYVSDGSDGETTIEQLYVDFLLSDSINVRIGRVLAPMGIINQNHEPTRFLGVERPNVEKYIIPTTWSLDGAGIFGSPLSWLSYQAYLVGGLDGENFDASNGVRKGRIKERGSLNDPAVSGRLDFYPFVDSDLPADQSIRIGLSGYYGGTDNKNNDDGNGVKNEFGMVSGDFEYDISRFRFRGVVAWGKNSDAEDLNDAFGNDAGEEVFGWYLEGGVSVMPDSWKTGKLVEADLIPFVRYEEYDTQYETSSGVVKDDNNDRSEVTVGVNFPLTQEFVLKADYQFRFDGSGSNPNNLFNLGMGWAFQ